MRRVPAEVRRATADDVDDVLELWIRARDELDRAGRHMPASAQMGDRLRHAVSRGEAEVLVARWDGRPAGYVMLRVAPLSLLADAPAVHLEQLWVAPELRRHGVARALLNAVVGRAERTGSEQVVTSVLPWARDTHRFFARLGFTPLVVRRAVPTPALRRRLAGESPRGALDDLLSRRRSLRARSRGMGALEPELAAAPDPEVEELPTGAPAAVVLPGPDEPVDVPAGARGPDAVPMP